MLYSVYGLLQVLRNNKSFTWVKYMSWLVLATSVITFIHIFPGRLEGKEWHKRNPVLECIFMTLMIFLFYFSQNLEYWLFGFTYWVITKEITQVLGEEAHQPDAKAAATKERRYKVAQWVGVAVNFLACAVVAWLRGLANYQLVTDDSKIDPEVLLWL